MLKNSHRLDFSELVREHLKKTGFMCLMISIMITILVLKGILSDSVVRVLSIDTESGFFWAISNLSNVSVICVDLLWFLFALCSIGLVFGLIFKMGDFYKTKLLLIKHSSLNVMKFTIEESELKEYSIAEFLIDQVQTMRSKQLSLRDRITCVINDQERLIRDIQNYISRNFNLAYIGIAHTPLVFFMGFLIGDENGVKLFHKRRDDADDKFHLLDNINYSETLNKHMVSSTQLDTIVLCIATTFEISDEDIKHICSKDNCVLRYSTSNKGYDVIFSAKQIRDYIKIIKDDLSDLCKNNQVKKVKICISSSVAFTFALAQSFSDHHDPEIEVYHYDTKNELKYPWGVNVTKRTVIITGEV